MLPRRAMGGEFGVLWPDSDKLHQWTMLNFLWSVDYSRSLNVFESDANVIWIKLSQIAGALRKGLRSTKYNRTACLSPRCYQMLVQCCKYVTSRRNAERGWEFALGVPESICFFPVVLLEWFFSGEKLSQQYLCEFWLCALGFFCFPHHFSYIVYLKDQLSLVWQLMLCVCLSNNRVVCIKAV